MKKYLKFLIPIVICVAVVGITFYMLFDIKNKVEKKAYSVEYINDDESNEVEDDREQSNKTEENSIKEENVNNIENKVDNKEENKVKESIKNNVDNILENNVKKQNENISSIYEDDTDNGTTDKKQAAINLVKEKWGKDDSVTYRCDSVTISGEYIIAVISKNSAVVKNYFRVNLETKSVIVDY